MATKRRFDGATYETEHDLERLSTQLERVKSLMLDGAVNEYTLITNSYTVFRGASYGKG